LGGGDWGRSHAVKVFFVIFYGFLLPFNYSSLVSAVYESHICTECCPNTVHGQPGVPENCQNTGGE
jgi:hypothetical protein